MSFASARHHISIRDFWPDRCYLTRPASGQAQLAGCVLVAVRSAQQYSKARPPLLRVRAGEPSFYINGVIAGGDWQRQTEQPAQAW